MSRWITDTHGLLWHLYNANKLSVQVKEIFTGADAGEHQIVVPAIVLVETVYLAERGRITADAVDNVLHWNLPLLTRDAKIQKLSNVQTVW